MAYSRLAVRVFSMSSNGSEAILPSTMKLSGDQPEVPNPVTDGDNIPSSKSPSSSPTPTKKGVTFANQDSLPKLPIPDLESTCRKYIESLVPLQSPREHEETKAAVHDFLKTDGPELQERLKKYASSKTSYIEQFWYDSYLNFDNSVVLNLNPFFLLEDDPTPARNNQVTRAASLVSSALSFVRAVRREELPPDKVKSTPLCMYQYSRLFGTARVPTENGCIIGQNATAKHIVVLCRGQFYWFDVLDDNNDVIMSEKDITINLQVILDDAQQTPIQEAAKGALGILSTENRKVWSGLRDLLTKDPGSNNAECLHIVDSAIFVLCLDHMEPTSTTDLCGNMLCGTSEIVRGVQIGTCINRWYDKLQIIVCQNGSAGINFEHTGVDGHTVLRFASDVYTDTILRYAKTINGQAPSLWASNSPDPAKRDPRSFGNVSTTPRKLQWDMIPELSIALRFAESHLADLLHQHEFQVLDFSGYGKSFITSAGFSPDAFVQMAFQAAYYGLYGRVENTYEPAMTKMFLHGRTEAIRPVTTESVDFVKTFWGDNPPEAKVAALKKATERHTAITKECAKAQGQDRHLYALFCVWQRSLDGVSSVDESGSLDDRASEDNGAAAGGGGGGYTSSGSSSSASFRSSRSNSNSSNSMRNRKTSPPPTVPAIFNDAGWDKINNTILSTSNCGNPALRHFGFGPTSGDGFGIGYIIKEDSISICASSKHRQTSRLMDTLESYLLEIRKLIRATSRKTTSPRTSRAREMEILSERLENRRGRLIRQDTSHGRGGTETPTTDSGDVEDDGMGGYGFFDAGMLLHALKGVHGERQRTGTEKVERRRPVGKKLQLAEY